MDELTDEQLAELQDPDTWDWDNGEVVCPDPNRPHGIYLGVQLDRAALDVLAPAARAAGVPLPQYVLDAALAYARQSEQPAPHGAQAG